MKSLALCALFLVLAACSVLPRRVAHPPSASATAGKVAVTQKGDAQTPAAARVDTVRTMLPLPSGVVVTVKPETGAISYALPSPTVATVERTTESATAPAAFTPPAPPTANEEATARADYWTTLALRAAVFLGIAAAAFGLIKDWTLVALGGGCFAAAGLFGLFQQRHPALLALLGAGVALAIAGPLLWRYKFRPSVTPSAP